MADNVSIKDATGATVVTRTTDSGGVHTARVIAEAGAAQYVDDADYNVGTSEGAVVMGVHDAAATTRTPTSGDVAAVSLDPNANQRVVLPTTMTASSAFNRPSDTTAYAANDAVADNTTAGSVTVSSWAVAKSAGTIRRVRIRKADQTVATPTIRLYLFSASPTVGAGDNAAFVAPLANCLGFVDVDVTTAGSDDAVGWANTDIPVTGATVYGLLQTRSAFTPASAETFTIDLWYYPG